MACERRSGSQPARVGQFFERREFGTTRDAPRTDVDPYDAVLGLRCVKLLNGDPVRRCDFRLL